MLFNKYKRYLIIDKNNFDISSFFYDEKFFLKKSFYYSLTSDEIDKVTTMINLYNEEKSNVVGDIVINLDNNEIGRLKIYKKRSKKKKEKSLFRKFIFEIF
jgi:hypothetical protein